MIHISSLTTVPINIF